MEKKKRHYYNSEKKTRNKKKIGLHQKNFKRNDITLFTVLGTPTHPMMSTDHTIVESVGLF